MIFSLEHLIAFVIISLLTTLSTAQTQNSEAIKPQHGLWAVEHGTTPENNPAPASYIGGGKFCVSPDMAEQSGVPLHGDGCDNVRAKREGHTMRYSFKCKDDSKTSGDGKVTFLSETAYTARTRLTVYENGKPRYLSAASIGRFISSDCGQYKPKSR